MTDRASVPCAGCTACCRHELVVLMPEDGDDPSTYEHELMRVGPGEFAPVLKRHPGGDCIYLGPGGCTIHGRAPIMCRVFDCRRFFLKFGTGKSRLKSEVISAGRARVHTLRRGDRP